MTAARSCETTVYVPACPAVAAKVHVGSRIQPKIGPLLSRYSRQSQIPVTASGRTRRSSRQDNRTIASVTRWAASVLIFAWWIIRQPRNVLRPLGSGYGSAYNRANILGS